MNTIAVLGKGRVGAALAAGLTRAGHQVAVGDRTPGSVAEALRAAEVVINATPGSDSLERLTELREDLRGKILIDVANATLAGPDGLPATLMYPDASLAERLQAALPDTRVVKTLNTMLSSVMADPAVLSQPPTAFLSGEDPEAKRIVGALLGDLGWRPEWLLDLGGIQTARATEAMMLLVPHVIRARGFAPFALAIAG